MESNGQGEQSRDNLEDNTGSEFNTVTSKDKKRKHGTPKTRIGLEKESTCEPQKKVRTQEDANPTQQNDISNEEQQELQIEDTKSNESVSKSDFLPKNKEPTNIFGRVTVKIVKNTEEGQKDEAVASMSLQAEPSATNNESITEEVTSESEGNASDSDELETSSDSNENQENSKETENDLPEEASVLFNSALAESAENASDSAESEISADTNENHENSEETEENSPEEASVLLNSTVAESDESVSDIVELETSAALAENQENSSGIEIDSPQETSTAENTENASGTLDTTANQNEDNTGTKCKPSGVQQSKQARVTSILKKGKQNTPKGTRVCFKGVYIRYFVPSMAEQVENMLRQRPPVRMKKESKPIIKVEYTDGRHALAKETKEPVENRKFMVIYDKTKKASENKEEKKETSFESSSQETSSGLRKRSTRKRQQPIENAVVNRSSRQRKAAKQRTNIVDEDVPSTSVNVNKKTDDTSPSVSMSNAARSKMVMEMFGKKSK